MIQESFMPSHGGDLLSYRERYPDVALLDFSSNVNPLGPPQSVADALQASVAVMASYPDPQCRALRAALSAYEDVPADSILCTNGAADLIYRLAAGIRPQRALITAPAFSEYEKALIQAGCHVDRHTLKAENDFRLTADFLGDIPGHDIVFLCTPNNPTGALVDPDLLERTAQACGESGAVLAMDECFLDFVDETAIYSAKRLLDNRCVVVIRAFTKTHAIPAIRLGYGIFADRALLAKAGAAGAEWSVSAPAQLCGIAACDERAYVQCASRLIHEERQCIQAAMAALGIRTFDSAANYLLFYTEKPDFHARMCAWGVLLRDCGNYHGLGQGYYRAAVRAHNDNTALLAALGEVMA